MKKIFLTYGDEGYEKAKQNITKMAESLGLFDVILTYGREDLPNEFLAIDNFKIKRGGGYGLGNHM